MPQLLIDTDVESVENLRDTVLLITAIADRKAKALATGPVLDAKPAPELSPTVFSANPSPAQSVNHQLPTGVTLEQAAAAAPPAVEPVKPKRTRKPRAVTAPPSPPVPLPPVVAATTEERRGPTITPEIAARIAEAGGAPPPPPPVPLTLVGETPATPAGPTFRDVMLVITQGLQSGKLTNAEVVEVCKRQGIDGPTALPAQPMLNGPVLAGLKMLLATKG